MGDWSGASDGCEIKVWALIERGDCWEPFMFRSHSLSLSLGRRRFGGSKRNPSHNGSKRAPDDLSENAAG